jgi:hypothetical protein
MGKSHRDERRSGKYIQNCFPELLAMAKLLISYARRSAHAMRRRDLLRSTILAPWRSAVRSVRVKSESGAAVSDNRKIMSERSN